MAVEDRGEDGIGRIRLGHLPDASSDSLSGFVGTLVAKGSAVKTDDGSGYLSLPSLGYQRWIMTSAALVLPHLVASLLKRWLLGTYQGAVKPTHLAYYLDEFTLRFNRRTSRSRGQLFYRLVQPVLLVEPIPEKELKAVVPGRATTRISMTWKPGTATTIGSSHLSESDTPVCIIPRGKGRHYMAISV
jgi:hypothetical protein